MTLTVQPQKHPNPGLLIIGAGPAGLSAAYSAVTQGKNCVVLEQSEQVGGLSRTESYKGYSFDIGGHRFFSEYTEIKALWKEIMGDKFIPTRRKSRIYFNGHFYQYPLEFFDALAKLGPVQGIKILLSFAWAKARPNPNEDTFEQWVVNRFGRFLYQTFFKAYTEKVWGMSCDTLCADWAAQRIQGLDLTGAIWNALTGRGDEKTLINRFEYPSKGAGMMWQKLHDILESKECRVRLKTKVNALIHNGHHITGIKYENPSGQGYLPVDQVISSAPLTSLASMLEPSIPKEIQESVSRLSYRAFVLVALIIQAKNLFPDQWIYIHHPGVKVARIQNFKNWGPDMVPDPAMTSLGMEYFCNEGDDLWTMPDDQMIEMAVRECSGLNFIKPGQVTDGVVIRQPRAYPVYNEAYGKSVETIQNYINGFENLQTVGRNGLHRYNNMDHSMLTGMAAAQNIAEEQTGLWAFKKAGPESEQPPWDVFMKAAGQ